MMAWTAHVECGRKGIDWGRLEDLCANLARKYSAFAYKFSATGRDLFIYADTEKQVISWAKWIEQQIGWLDYRVHPEET